MQISLVKFEHVVLRHANGGACMHACRHADRNTSNALPGAK